VDTRKKSFRPFRRFKFLVGSQEEEEFQSPDEEGQGVGFIVDRCCGGWILGGSDEVGGFGSGCGCDGYQGIVCV
jgi:hypothetical protein